MRVASCKLQVRSRGFSLFSWQSAPPKGSTPTFALEKSPLHYVEFAEGGEDGVAADGFGVEAGCA